MDPLFLGYLTLTAALVVTPGATTAVVVRNTLASGRWGGFSAAMGAAGGNATHATVAGLGLAVVVARSPTLLVAIKVGGGLYLGWLGLASLRRIRQGTALRTMPSPVADRMDFVHHHAFREGLTVNLLNPAIATFYLAVVPSFLPASAPPGYYVELAAIHVGMAFVCHNAWAIGMDRLSHLLEAPRARVYLEGVTAMALLGLSARVLVSAAP